jgi:ABC-type nitrate/sulfonate/bicarbonate transport system substrate-binding protein
VHIPQTRDGRAGSRRRNRSGRLEFAEPGSAPYVQAALDGRDTVILLAALAPLSTGLPILTRPAISDPRELEGKRLGVLTNTGQVAISVRSALNTWGVSATLVPLGTFGAIYAALGSGEVDAGALSADYRFLGPREYGLRVLDTPSAGYVPVVVGCSRRLIAADRRLVSGVVQAYRKPACRRGSIRILCAAPSAVAAPIGTRSPDSSSRPTAGTAVRRPRFAGGLRRFVVPR